MSRHAATERISPHFTWGEFAMRDGTLPPDELYAGYVALARLWLEPLRQAFGVTTVYSGWRSLEHNRAVGGAPASFHLGRRRPAAVAADVGCKSGTPREWFAALDRLGAPGLGLYTTHVHVDNRPGRARW